MAEDSSRTLPVGDLLANDTAASNVLGNTSSPQHGTLQVNRCVNPNTCGFRLGLIDSFSYIPAPNFNGLDWFQYQVGHTTEPGSGFATVFLNVTPVRDEPVAVDDTFTVEANTTVTLNAFANDSDPDGLHVAVVPAGPPGPDGDFHGMFEWDPDGTIRYRPDGAVPQITIPYRLFGDHVASFATVTINVTPNPTVDDSTSRPRTAFERLPHPACWRTTTAARPSS